MSRIGKSTLTRKDVLTVIKSMSTSLGIQKTSLDGLTALVIAFAHDLGRDIGFCPKCGTAAVAKRGTGLSTICGTKMDTLTEKTDDTTNVGALDAQLEVGEVRLEPPE